MKDTSQLTHDSVCLKSINNSKLLSLTDSNILSYVNRSKIFSPVGSTKRLFGNVLLFVHVHCVGIVNTDVNFCIYNMMVTS